MKNEANKKKSVGEEIGEAVGAEVGQEIGKEIEKHFTENGKKQTKVKTKSLLARRIEYLFGLIFNLIFLLIVFNFEKWDWRFITDEWSQVGDNVKFSIYLGIIIYAAFMLYDKKFFYYLGKLAINGIGFYVGVRMFQVFPFDFNHLFGWGWLNNFFPWIIILGLVTISVDTLVRTVRLVSGKEIY